MTNATPADRPTETGRPSWENVYQTWKDARREGPMRKAARRLLVLGAEGRLPEEAMDAFRVHAARSVRRVEKLMRHHDLSALEVHGDAHDGHPQLPDVARIWWWAWARSRLTDEWVPAEDLARLVMGESSWRSGERLSGDRPLRAALARCTSPAVREYVCRHMPADEFVRHWRTLALEAPNRSARALLQASREQRQGLKAADIVAVLARSRPEHRSGLLSLLPEVLPNPNRTPTPAP